MTDQETIDRAYEYAEENGGWVRTKVKESRHIHLPNPDPEKALLCNRRWNTGWRHHPHDAFPQQWIEEMFCPSCEAELTGEEDDPTVCEDKSKYGRSPDDFIPDSLLEDEELMG